MASVDMDFSYAEAFGELEHDAYETLLLDCMLGEATLFTRSDEVEAAWAVVDPIIDFWANKRPDHFPNYAGGHLGADRGRRVHRPGGREVAGAVTGLATWWDTTIRTRCRIRGSGSGPCAVPATGRATAAPD